MHEFLDRRLLFFGGKGGAGKTTCAAAIALAASRQGRRVLLVSTDPAHSTSDIFQRPFSREEREVGPGLVGLEIDAEFEADRYLREVRDQIARLFSPAVLKAAMRQLELAATLPGVSDAALFDRLTQLVLDRERQYDLLVFDTAPTGHTLRLLQMPELMSGWIHALAARRREAVEMDRLAQGMPAEAGSADPVLESLVRRATRLSALRSRLTDRRTAAFVLVLVPERLAIDETGRAIRALEASTMHVGGLVVNRVLPPDLTGDFYQARKAQERVYLDEIERRFAAFHPAMVPLFARDICGVDQLGEVARFLMA